MSGLDTGSLLESFVTEARELLEQAGRSLLALERSADAEALAALFRAVHTLKGTSGLFDIAPLTRVVHAAEDLLAAVQSGRCRFGSDKADVTLDALDQVGAWVEALAGAAALPPDAEAMARGLESRLRAALNGAAPPAAPAAEVAGGTDPGAELPAWVSTLASCVEHGVALGAPLLAVRYRPDPHCFFRGEDPLGLMRQVPELRALRAEPVTPWPSLDALDPFHCNLSLTAVAAAQPEELEALFRYVREQVEILALPAGWPADRDANPAAPAGRDLAPAERAALQTVLTGQRRLLEADGAAIPWEARLEAAAQALRGVVRWTGRADLERGLEEALDAARAAGGPQPLLGFVASSWHGATTVHDGAAASSGPRGAAPSVLDAAPADPPRSAAPALLRVEQGKIDTLMTLIGELVVAKNGLAYLARQADQGTLTPRELAREIKDRHALVNRIAEEMQGAVMAVRMLPVDHVFQRFPRLVRDIARRLGKQAELVIEGGATEADKNVIEALADPLVHMVRNSLDHGIETPAERLAAGKPAHGTIRLEAVQDNDKVVIRIRDDGRGIDPEAVRRKAVEKGLLEAERAAALSEQEAIALVFAAGFSTAAEVSDLSGRGVGMDVVRSTVEKAGGQVTLQSRHGAGTVVELTLPLSMAVTRIMTVACGERLFGVPMAQVMETVRIPARSLHRIRDREAFVLRDSIIPVVRLARLLDLPDAEEAASEEEAILVVRVQGERLGIVVGAFREGMEAIVRPLEGVLAGLRGFSGTTLLGDGRVLLILDLRELVE